MSKHESEDDLRGKLTAEQYDVTQKAGTERPFSGKYVDHKGDGTYACICCDAPIAAAPRATEPSIRAAIFKTR